MYEIKVHNRINQIMKIYRVFVGRIEDESTDFLKIRRKLMYLILYLSFLISMLLGGSFSDDWNEFVFLISLSILILVASVKLIYILWKSEEICALINEIGSHSVANYKEYIKIEYKVKQLMRFSTIFFLIVFVTMGISFGFCLKEESLPFNIWFPFYWRNNAIVYWIEFAYEWFGILSSFTISLINAIIWYLMINCAIKYQILGNQFRRILLTRPTAGKSNISDLENENLFLLDLIGQIKSHQIIQRMIDRFTSCFSNIFFAQITTSGICICGSVYVLAFNFNSKNLVQTVVNFAVMLHSIFDIFMVMYLSNEIKLSSSRLSYCLFESNWLTQSKICKKNIIILAEVLKKPHELVIGKVYRLDMETFISIVKFAYSMFNILQNLSFNH